MIGSEITPGETLEEEWAINLLFRWTAVSKKKYAGAERRQR